MDRRLPLGWFDRSSAMMSTSRTHRKRVGALRRSSRVWLEELEGRIAPAVWERETGIKLRFVPTKSGGVLVADAFYRRQAARYQGRKSFRAIKEAGPSTGRQFVVIFVLVRQAKLRKRLDVDATAQKWAALVPGTIASKWSL